MDFTLTVHSEKVAAAAVKGSNPRLALLGLRRNQ
jgi:hypothetical protein